MLAETTTTTVSTITTKASTTTTTASEAVTGNLVYSNFISNVTFITKYPNASMKLNHFM